MSDKEEIIPEIGMGATHVVGSDSYPYTIIWVSKGKKKIIVQSDDYFRTDNNGMSEQQEYIYKKNVNGTKHTVRMTKPDRWVSFGMRFVIGSRRAYFDPSF